MSVISISISRSDCAITSRSYHNMFQPALILIVSIIDDTRTDPIPLDYSSDSLNAG